MSGDRAFPRIFLVGFMGSGKTSVARALAARLRADFFDTDAWIEAREARSVAEVFQSHGEAYFRARESEALEAACRSAAAVVATGGGLFLSDANRARIREHGVSVWLDTPLERIWERCRESQERPLWGTREELAELLASRSRVYREADWRMETGGRDVEAIVLELMRLVVPGSKEV